MNRQIVINTVKLGVITMIMLLLASCAAMSTALSHKDLDVQTKMSNSIFLPPVAAHQKVVYVEIHNTSGRPFNLQPTIAAAIKSQGYRITTNPKHAHFFLQANVKSIAKTDKSAAESAFGSPYGSALSGALVGAGAGAVVGGSTGSTVAGGLIGGLVSTVADSLEKNVTFVLIVDIQVTAKLPNGQSAKTQTIANTQDGSSTQTITHYSGMTHDIRYRTRIVSLANKANLTFEEAAPVLKQQLSQSIAGIF